MSYDTICTYNQSECSALIQQLEHVAGDAVTTDPSRWKFSNPEYKKIHDLWIDASFNKDSIQWINYYPHKHYDATFSENIAAVLNLSRTHRSWISRINPGYYAPLHWDIDDNEARYLSHGEIKRYSMMMTASIGHLFILDDTYIYNKDIGTIIQWHDHRAWHAGSNAGLKSKYMFHILGC